MEVLNPEQTTTLSYLRYCFLWFEIYTFLYRFE